MSTFLEDVRFTLRLLARSPGFTAFAVLTLALGIGANAGVFSLANSLFLRPLPVEDPGRLAAVWATMPDGGGYIRISHPDYLDFREKGGSFEGLLAYRLTGVVLGGDAGGRGAEQLWGFLASGNYFDVLGVRPAVGRGFLPEEDATPGTHPVVVFSHQLWQRRFGGDPGIVGRTVRLNNLPFTVVGIAPEGFTGTEPLLLADFWVPTAMQREAEAMQLWLPDRSMGMLSVLGRLRDGVGPEQAAAELAGIAAEIAGAYPDSHRGRGVAVLPPSLIEPAAHSAAAAFVALLVGIVGLVLLMACANLAGLLLARATGRQREIAVRLALGASRGRLVRQLLTESAILGVAGGAAGLLVGHWLARALSSFRPEGLPLALTLDTDPRVLAFTLGLALATGLVFGLAPALQATRPDLVPALKEGAAAGEQRGRARLRHGLVVAQVALSLLLLVGAGLFLKSLGRMRQADPGFAHDRIYLAPIELGRQGYDGPRAAAFSRQLGERLAAVPGVAGVTRADFAPFDQNPSQAEVFRDVAGGRAAVIAYYSRVAPGYFEAIGLPLLAGRGFTRSDLELPADAPRRPVVVNQTLARTFFGDADPLGRTIPRQRTGDQAYEVVGVARDGMYVRVGEPPKPFLYRALPETASSYTLFVRTLDDPARLAGTVRDEVARLDRELPLLGAGTMVEHMAITLLPAQLATVVLSAFGGLALLLGAIGVYGVVSYAVGRRTREIGIRVALGARPGQVLKLVLGGAARLALLGIGIGLLLAAALTRFAGSLLFGVGALDPATFGLVALVLAAVALTAGYLPARWALDIEPSIALRQE